VSWVTSGTGGLLVPDSLLGFVLRLGCLPWLAGTGRDPRTTTWPWTHRRQG